MSEFVIPENGDGVINTNIPNVISLYDGVVRNITGYFRAYDTMFTQIIVSLLPANLGLDDNVDAARTLRDEIDEAITSASGQLETALISKSSTTDDAERTQYDQQIDILEVHIEELQTELDRAQELVDSINTANARIREVLDKARVSISGIVRLHAMNMQYARIGFRLYAYKDTLIDFLTGAINSDMTNAIKLTSLDARIESASEYLVSRAQAENPQLQIDDTIPFFPEDQRVPGYNETIPVFPTDTAPASSNSSLPDADLLYIDGVTSFHDDFLALRDYYTPEQVADFMAMVYIDGVDTNYYPGLSPELIELGDAYMAEHPGARSPYAVYAELINRRFDVSSIQTLSRPQSSSSTTTPSPTQTPSNPYGDQYSGSDTSDGPGQQITDYGR